MESECRRIPSASHPRAIYTQCSWEVESCCQANTRTRPLAEEGDEPEIEPEMPSHGESLSKGKGGVIERRETLFLNEADSHNVWKGQPREQGPLLADVALVALRKKREKDLRKRQHSLYSRIAATQVALKDQTEELLGGQEEEENENVDETREKEKTRDFQTSVSNGP